SLPRPDGWIHGWLLTGPAVLAVPIALVGAAGCALVDPESAAAAFVLAVPTVWAGMLGAVVNAVRDQFDPTGPRSRSSALVVPMEVSGVQDVVRLLWPVALSTVPVLAVLAVRAQPGVGTVLRAAAGLGLWLAAARWWVVHRQSLRSRWREFAAGAA